MAPHAHAVALQSSTQILDPTKIEVTTVTTDITETVSIHNEIKKHTSGRPVLQPYQAAQDRERKAREEREKAAAEMQNWWDAAMVKNFNAHSYDRVAVLIIKWIDRLDDLKLSPEAKELSDLFRNKFNYNVETVALNDGGRKPQHQLNAHLTNFVAEHDGPNSLLIVYYTGHAEYLEFDKYLEICASATESHKGYNYRANWNQAEEVLHRDDVEGHVLTIMDTCFSSNLQMSVKDDARMATANKGARISELWAASAINQTTSSPARGTSFTRVFIETLEKLLLEHPDDYFTTYHVNQAITKDHRRFDTPSLLWQRLGPNQRFIRLAPLKRKEAEELQIPSRSYLTLRFAIGELTLTRDQIFELTHNLSLALHDTKSIGLRRIDWINHEPARVVHWVRTYRAVAAITHWWGLVKWKRAMLQAKKSQERLTVEMDIDGTQTPTITPTSSRKRARDDEAISPVSKKASLPLDLDSLQVD